MEHCDWLPHTAFRATVNPGSLKRMSSSFVDSYHKRGQSHMETLVRNTGVPQTKSSPHLWPAVIPVPPASTAYVSLFLSVALLGVKLPRA